MPLRVAIDDCQAVLQMVRVSQRSDYIGMDWHAMHCLAIGLLYLFRGSQKNLAVVSRLVSLSVPNR